MVLLNPSLLSGLLEGSAGQPFLATHAVKGGNRYRYYVSGGTSRGAKARVASGDNPSPSSRRWRIPATEIEDGVVRLLCSRLCDETWLLTHFVEPEASIADWKAILERGALAAHLRSSDPVAFRTVALGLLERVVLSDAEISLTIKTDLFAELSTRESPIVETAPFNLARRGVEKRLVLHGGAERPPEPDPALLKGLAQAHRWWQDLLSRRFSTMREIAQAYQTDERYVSRIVTLAFAPATLKQQIVNGTQPIELTLSALLQKD